MYDTVHNLPVKVPHLSVIIGSTAPFVPMERHSKNILITKCL